MNNRYRLKINLHALKNAFVSTIKGKETTRRCVCIPIEDNHLFVGSEEKGKPVYLDMVAFAMKEPRDWATHVLKQSLKREIVDKIKSEGGSLPILGNLQPDGDMSFADDDDAPF